jgi:hypothetical protein
MNNKIIKIKKKKKEEPVLPFRSTLSDNVIYSQIMKG